AHYGQSPLAAWPGVAAPYGLAAGDSRLRACYRVAHASGGRARKRRPCGLALAVGGRPYMEAGRGWPLLLLATFATKTQ
ncbi:hypothetical protein BHM03_00012692, partial [Ensete ventricosum]